MNASVTNPYLHLVSEFSRIVSEGRSLPLGGFAAAQRGIPVADAPYALFFAPHPDDETITGGLALRLLRESGWRVVDIAVTLGSKQERKEERWQELQNACHYLGFGVERTAPGGLDSVRPDSREREPQAWAEKVKVAAGFLEKYRPKAIFCPHELDVHSTHIGTHFLVVDALRAAKIGNCFLVEAEFWGQMNKPNLMVEYTTANVADLVAATSFHRGEVQRNPYHLLIPAWMQDNVRRGAELVGGAGQGAPSFMFAQLYRLRRWNGSQLENCWEGGRYLPAATLAATLFPS
ncbi:MAG: PIG-L deacetylase family protein [Limisphaerales bacterium]